VAIARSNGHLAQFDRFSIDGVVNRKLGTATENLTEIIRGALSRVDDDEDGCGKIGWEISQYGA
jgi:hypothetical protein